ncbi:MAG TPA: aspartate aminotransferase family protein, partial [Chitinophagaceae bacterium]|nr:aspartate aminotransferase family protein [Chitinophagaceae bacterium]
GNPVAMIAGYTLLKILKENPSIYTELEEKTNSLHQGLNEIFKASAIPYVINQAGSMISIHFSEKTVIDFNSAANCNIELFKKFFHAMLKRGVYLPPSAFETWFICNALTKVDIAFTVNAAKESLQEIIQ